MLKLEIEKCTKLTMLVAVSYSDLGLSLALIYLACFHMSSNAIIGLEHSMKARVRGFVVSHIQGKLSADADEPFRRLGYDIESVLNRLIELITHSDCLASRPNNQLS